MSKMRKRIRKQLSQMFRKEEKLLSRCWKRDKSIRSRMIESKNLFKDLCNTSKPFLKMLSEIIPNDGSFHFIYPMLFRKLPRRKEMSIRTPAVKKFLAELDLLYDSYSMAFSIKNSGDRGFECGFNYSSPSYITLQITGQNLEVMSDERRLYPHFKKMAKFGHLLNEIEIEDDSSPANINRGLSQLYSILSLARNKISPTIIKYNYQDLIKRFLIYIPEELSITRFVKIYGNRLTKSHNGFYQKTYRKGAPESRSYQISRIKKILEQNKDQLKTESLNKLYQFVASKIGTIAPRSLQREYKSYFKDFKKGCE